MRIVKDLHLLTKLQVAVYSLYNKAWVREPQALLTLIVPNMWALDLDTSVR